MNWILQQHTYNWGNEQQFLNYLRQKLPIIVSSGTTVSSVSNADGTLTITPTTGDAVVSLNLGHANTWTALQTGTMTTALALANAASGATSFINFSMGGISFSPSSLINAVIIDGNGNMQFKRTDAGLVLPLLTTTQKNAFAATAGTVIFDTTLVKMCIRVSGAWQTVTSA